MAASFDAVDHAWLIRFVEHRIGDRRLALSREPEFATRSPEVTARAHAAVAARHVRNAVVSATRSVRRDVRWRWTLKVLRMAA